jgi:hypothetical protein
MLQKLSALTLFFLFLITYAFGQTATINGVVKDEQGKPVDQATVAVEGTGIGTQTDTKGGYTLQVPAGKEISVVYNYLSYEVQKKSISLNAGEHHTIDIILKLSSHNLDSVVVKADQSRYEAGSVSINAAKANVMPSAIGGIEGIIATLVGSHNELTSQYSVRGGSYDENLIYVNDFEIYRPFLVQSGQQEGLSFINADLVQNVNFSVGGFQAKYGDKMSSVLDVTYKTPTHFAGSVEASLLGAALHLEGASKNQKLTYLIGARQKSDQYLLQSQPTKGVYNPSFTDIQALVKYRFNSRWEIEFIGNYARNRFTFYPQTETTSFGVVNQAYQLDVFYTGGEIDQFDSHFGGVSATYHANERFKIKFLASGFQTKEQETYDINGEYLFGQLQTDASQANYGQINTYLGTGIIQDYTRDYLQASVGTVAIRGAYDGGKHFIQFGADATITSINDNLLEWERRDSAGYTQPYNPALLSMADYLKTTNSFNYTRLSGFVQDNFRPSSSSGFTATGGVRYNYSFLNEELIISPRLQMAYKPQGEKDIVFRFATGLYAQPAFYKEMENMEGGVNQQLKAQKSYHIVLGTDYNFKLYNRPFKVTAEAYYKDLWDIDPYVYDNVQVRYTAKNDAVGYVYGGEVRLYGDLVKDATSWISIGLMKARQKLTDSASLFPGYFPLPSDQPFMLGMYFEDYLPTNKNFKMHLNLIYASGLPVGPPDSHLWQDDIRLPAYKRVDIGFSALLLDAARRQHPVHNIFGGIKSIWASLEVFDLLGIQNTLSYNWIQDQTSGKTFAVPNLLTSRLLNLKVIFNF